MYQIEDDIPLPDAVEGKYPFNDLKVDQSFLVPLFEPGEAVPQEKFADLKREREIAARRSVGVSMGRAAKRLNRTFEARTIDGGVRVWRTA